MAIGNMAKGNMKMMGEIRNRKEMRWGCRGGVNGDGEGDHGDGEGDGDHGDGHGGMGKGNLSVWWRDGDETRVQKFSPFFSSSSEEDDKLSVSVFIFS
jgi:hypothetical protein